MNELDITFKEYIEAFKQLDIVDKRKEIINRVNEITAMFDMLAAQADLPVSYLKSKEILELKDGSESEDDYLEALLVYVENAKSVLGQYLLKLTGE